MNGQVLKPEIPGFREYLRQSPPDASGFHPDARQELTREYLNRPEMDVAEIAYLVGYEDSNSFYRAFRTWEGTTPAQLRFALRRSNN